MMKRIVCRVVLLVCGLCMVAPLLAQVSARVDRNPIDLGESLTLTITPTHAAAAPDLSPLMADFDLIDQQSSRSTRIINGQSSTSTVYQLTIEPKRAGELIIPAIAFGAQSTAPITLTVRPAPAITGRDNNADIFVETEVDELNPYVQQSVGVTLRLFYAVPLVSGDLDLDPPEGALMQKIGDDIQSNRDLNGRRYNVLEQRFLLVPERSGVMTLPGPRFRGRGAGGWFDDLMGGNRSEMRTAGVARTLNVRPQPDGAPQPWLPLRDLRLRYVGVPDTLAVGGSATVIVEGTALGATQAQLPQIAAPTIDGAQVFAEPVQYDESFVNGTPQVKWTQRYAVVPERAGRRVLAGLRISWWDVRTGQARVTRLPDLPLQVGEGSATSTAATPQAVDTISAVSDEATAPSTDINNAANIWRGLAVGFAGLWLLTLMWALRRRVAPSGRASHAEEPPRKIRTRAELKQALDTGTLDDVADALLGLADPPARDLDTLSSRLASAPQREALEALRRARWADGDGAAARALLRQAFAKGPVWQARTSPNTEPLPPLYPRA